ncbi:hypothetical protein PAMA_010197 [Pampus argenteus]
MEQRMSEENIEEVLEVQYQHLQAEVAALQCQQQDNHTNMSIHFRGQMQEALSYICGKRKKGGKEEVLSRLKEEVEELEEDLQRQTQMNGISLTSCTTKTLQSSDSKLVQQFCVSGHCSELLFQVEFQISDVKHSQISERTINSLNVVMDATDLQNFSPFLSGDSVESVKGLFKIRCHDELACKKFKPVEESKDLLLFFRTLRAFSDRCDERRRTFQHFQQFNSISLIIRFKSLMCSSVEILINPGLLVKDDCSSHFWKQLIFRQGVVVCWPEFMKTTLSKTQLSAPSGHYDNIIALYVSE